MHVSGNTLLLQACFSLVLVHHRAVKQFELHCILDILLGSKKHLLHHPSLSLTCLSRCVCVTGSLVVHEPW